MTTMKNDQPPPWKVGDVAHPMAQLGPPDVTGPNPNRIGACACGAYRADGRWPYLHKPGCQHDDLQFDRWLAEEQAGDHGGRPLTEHDTQAS